MQCDARTARTASRLVKKATRVDWTPESRVRCVWASLSPASVAPTFHTPRHALRAQPTRVIPAPPLFLSMASRGAGTPSTSGFFRASRVPPRAPVPPARSPPRPPAPRLARNGVTLQPLGAGSPRPPCVTAATADAARRPPLDNHPPKAGVLPPAAAALAEVDASNKPASSSSDAAGAAAVASAVAAAAAAAADAAAPPASPGSLLYPPDERSNIRDSWDSIMRWSRKTWRDGEKGATALERCDKIAVFGGGSFGTAMAVALARQKPTLDVCLLLRDAYVCRNINDRHVNERYLPGRTLPLNVRATTDPRDAIIGAQYALHAVPVQHSRAFLEAVKDVLPPDTPIVSVSKGLEVSTGQMLSDLIPSALGRKQPTVFLSGPSFAAEVMDGRPTGLVAASRDKKLGLALQQLLASPAMRINTTSDVVGVELCGALKNVLAIAAGIVEGLGLGANAKAALVSQGCAEIRWLAAKMGAKPATVAGLSGVGDIMLTCYGELSRNRAVGVRLGRGETLSDILAPSSQVAEGVATAGVVVRLARKYRVALPVLTAVAQVLDGALSPAEAVAAVMALPQIEER